MEIQNVPLPEDIVQGAAVARGNFATKNASYRRAVCNHLGLQWRSINGAGNCFFAAVSTCLLATLPSDRTNHLVGETRLRALVVEWLEQQTRLEEDLAERVQAEIDAELHVRSFSHSFIVTSTNHQDDVHHVSHYLFRLPCYVQNEDYPWPTALPLRVHNTSKQLPLMAYGFKGIIG